jgi:hypothetical protein
MQYQIQNTYIVPTTLNFLNHGGVGKSTSTTFYKNKQKKVNNLL